MSNAQKEAAAATAKREKEVIEANSGLTAPTPAQKAQAQQEGAKEAIKEAAADTYRSLTDGVLPGAPPAAQYHGSDEIMQYAGILDLSPEAFAEKLEKGGPVPEEKVAGLLKLERAGQNRTFYVQTLCKRLGIKDPRDVTDAGPGYTNDETPVTAL